MPATAPRPGFGRIARSYPRPAAPPPVTPAASAELIKQFALGWGGYGYGGFGWYGGELGAESVEARRAYPHMAFAEASVKAPLLDRIYSVQQQDWTVTPADRKDAGAKAVADAFKQALEDCRGGVPAVVWAFGFHPCIDPAGRVLCETVLKQELDPETGKRGIEKIAARPPSSYTVRADDYGNLEAVVGGGGGEYAGDALGRFVLYAPLAVYGALAGACELRAAFRAYRAKDAATKLRAFYLDKLAGGFLVATNVTEQNRAAMQAALAASRASGFITLDRDMDVKVLDLAMGADAAFKSACDDYDREMMIGVNGSHLPHQEGQTPGARGDTKVQESTASNRAWKLSSDVAGFINGPILSLWLAENYASARRPRFVWGGVDSQAQTAAVNDVLNLAKAGFRPDPEQVTERTGWTVTLAPPVTGTGVPGAPGQPGGGQPGAFADDSWELVPAGA